MADLKFYRYDGTTAVLDDKLYRPNGAAGIIRADGPVKVGDGTASEEGDLYIAGPRPYIDVRAYGAKGDGTIETTAIQKAIDAAQAAKVPVYFPAPKNASSYYRINAPLLITADYTRLIGATNGVVIHSSSLTGDVIQIIPGTSGIPPKGVELRNLTLTGGGYQFPGHLRRLRRLPAPQQYQHDMAAWLHNCCP